MLPHDKGMQKDDALVSDVIEQKKIAGGDKLLCQCDQSTVQGKTTKYTVFGDIEGHEMKL